MFRFVAFQEEDINEDYKYREYRGKEIRMTRDVEL